MSDPGTDSMPPSSSLDLGPLILGGAGFSYQLTTNPHGLPATSILKRSFDLGVRTIDTSPYYHPSEEILGAALKDPFVASSHPRESYTLMTKCGRIEADRFDYSPAWIRSSVQRSLQRFQTGYLDVVFCHDVEYVSLDEAVGAVGALFELKKTGAVRNAGVSGYDLDVLIAVAAKVRERYGMPVDVVQCWAQLSLQNTRLETYGLAALKGVGVRTVCSSSPLACGLLRDGGVPVGALGDWHPAPAGLRECAQAAAQTMGDHGEKLSAVALRYAISRAVANSVDGMTVSTITGIGSLDELEENVATARQLLGDWSRPMTGSGRDTQVDDELIRKDATLYGLARDVLGKWIDYDFSSKK
ncbi:D-arabinose 1-dehydrogenase [Sphaceloma murrayae]|uniref:D-arabinose 1-dehydrogenase n=1 Tax=Sphaceloma murrayae TaxID=2082308 RepID=A0A2K1QKZ5_9PEZI|nr:D-arabinose 1-dehydrogenase [Sphaceloma murrayae]